MPNKEREPTKICGTYNPMNCRVNILKQCVGNKAKGQISKWVFQENKARQIFPLHTYVCESGGKKCLFFGKFGLLCFLVAPVLRFALYLITDERNIVV